MANGEINPRDRHTPFDHLPQEIREGVEFQYETGYWSGAKNCDERFTVACRIAAVEQKGGEFLGSSAPSYSIGGKTEHDWSRSRGRWAEKFTTVRVIVDMGVPSVSPFEVVRTYAGWRWPDQ